MFHSNKAAKQNFEEPFDSAVLLLGEICTPKSPFVLGNPNVHRWMNGYRKDTDSMGTHERNLAQCFHIDSPVKAGQPWKDNRNTDNPEDRESEVTKRQITYDFICTRPK